MSTNYDKKSSESKPRKVFDGPMMTITTNFGNDAEVSLQENEHVSSSSFHSPTGVQYPSKGFVVVSRTPEEDNTGSRTSDSLDSLSPDELGKKKKELQREMERLKAMIANKRGNQEESSEDKDRNEKRQKLKILRKANTLVGVSQKRIFETVQTLAYFCRYFYAEWSSFL